MAHLLISPRGHLLIGLTLAAALLGLAVYAWNVDSAGWEIGIVRWVQQDAPPGLRPVSIALAMAGTGLPWAVLVGVFCVVLLALSGIRAAALLLVTALLQDVGAAIKVIVERARPGEGSVEVWRQISSHSFPSGHVLGATLVFGFLIVALEHCAIQPPIRRTLQTICLAWIGLMGLGRMELGAHWPTDVIGGYITGALLLLPIVSVLRRSAGPLTHAVAVDAPSVPS